MNKEIFEGRWHELKGSIKEEWASITDKDLDKINGKAEKLIGYLEKNYGYTKEIAEEKIAEITKKTKKMYEQDGKKIIKACNHYIHDLETTITKKPLQSALIAFGAGVLIDRLMRMCSSKKCE